MVHNQYINDKHPLWCSYHFYWFRQNPITKRTVIFMCAHIPGLFFHFFFHILLHSFFLLSLLQSWTRKPCITPAWTGAVHADSCCYIWSSAFIPPPANWFHKSLSTKGRDTECGVDLRCRPVFAFILPCILFTALFIWLFFSLVGYKSLFHTSLYLQC